MMRKLLFVLALGFSMSAMGQVLNVTSIDKVNLPDKAAVAAISPQGDYLLLTSATNQGLNKLDLTSGQTQTLSNAPSAGHNVKISPDGQTVVYREGSFNNKHLRMSTLKSVNLATGASQVLVKPTRNLQGYAVDATSVGAVNKGKYSNKAIGTAKAQKLPVLSINKGQLMITVNGKTRQLSPNGTQFSYMWASLSPDGTKVLFYQAAHGTYVCNLDGTDVRKVGKMRAPVWYDDNTIVGMMDLDDGEFIYASTIVAATLDGTMQTLTDDSVIAMYPHAAAGKIAFSTPAGEAYIINVTK
jgi:Tol biopolymer transport system component